MDFIQDQSSERREYPRIELETKISVKTPERSSIIGWIQNISLGGFKLKADILSNFKDIFHIGEEVFFETSEAFFMLKGKGRIIWTAPGENWAGVKFDELDHYSSKFLKDFLKMF